ARPGAPPSEGPLGPPCRSGRNVRGPCPTTDASGTRMPPPRGRGLPRNARSRPRSPSTTSDEGASGQRRRRDARSFPDPRQLPHRPASPDGRRGRRSSPEPPERLVAGDLTQLHDVLHDLAAPELRLPELAVAEGVWNLDDPRCAGPRDHLEPDLEADRVEANPVDRPPPDGEESAGRIADRHEHASHHARDPRDDAPAHRPVPGPTSFDVTAADGEVGARVHRADEPRPDLSRIRR